MGIYVFNKKLLEQILDEDARNPASSHDFGTDILGPLVEKYDVCAHNFIDENKKEAQYWRDVGTIESYYEANMDLVAVTPLFNLYDKEWPIRTHQRQYPPAKFVFADEGKRMGIAVDSIVSGGCIVSGGRVQNSILSPDVRVNSFCEISNSIIYAHCDIGRRSRIRNAIIDRDVHLPERTIIGYDPEEDRRRYHVSESGIVVVAPERYLCRGSLRLSRAALLGTFLIPSRDDGSTGSAAQTTTTGIHSPACPAFLAPGDARRVLARLGAGASRRDSRMRGSGEDQWFDRPDAMGAVDAGRERSGPLRSAGLARLLQARPRRRRVPQRRRLRGLLSHQDSAAPPQRLARGPGPVRRPGRRVPQAGHDRRRAHRSSCRAPGCLRRASGLDRRGRGRAARAGTGRARRCG